jgi:hypothetical protein
MRKFFAASRKRLVLATLTVAALVGAGTLLVKPTKAFTLIELTAFTGPVELIGLDTANVVLHNMSSQEVRATINWGDAITGAALGTSDALIMPGKGFVANLPAVQSGPALPAVQRWITATLKYSPAPGTATLPTDVVRKIATTENVIDGTTNKVIRSQGLASLPYIFQ